MLIENIYKKTIQNLTNLLNLTFEQAEKFFITGLRELLK